MKENSKRKKSRPEKVSEFIGLTLMVIAALGVLWFMMAYDINDISDTLEITYGGMAIYMTVLMVVGIATVAICLTEVIDSIFFVDDFAEASKNRLKARKEVRKLYGAEKITRKEKKIRYRLIDIEKLKQEIEILKEN